MATHRARGSHTHPVSGGHDGALSEEPGVALAWRILSSPTTMLTLCALLALVLALGAALPQRPLPAELARHLPFASAEAAAGLGLTDVLVAWPTLLLLLLIGLNAAGLILAGRARGGPSRFTSQATATVAEPLDSLRTRAPVPLRFQGARASGRRGLYREGALLALLGLGALLAALAISRASALDARLRLAPGSGAVSDASTRDGDLYLARSLGIGLICERPDPQDPHRAFGCRLAAPGATTATELSLAPGYTTRADDLSFTPLSEEVRPFSAAEPLDLVLTRNGAAQRLRLEPGTTATLGATQEHLTALPDGDGPLVVLERDGTRPMLLAPPMSPTAPTAIGDLTLEAQTPTVLFVSATTSPEAPLLIAGVLLVALGLLLMGLVPHVEVELTPEADGTRVTVWSANRPARPHEVLARFIARPEAKS